ncbi:hypothetical protein RRG08_013472 [Elysia crispata]|uniref:Uncharacterized protein n=1 Tax=Elysia crispata TaxID=231223 RepID=A0AAE1DPA3_9GAST|nr:hypothetical protein RRG08_013472 [Elysia crispata]
MTKGRGPSGRARRVPHQSRVLPDTSRGIDSPPPGVSAATARLSATSKQADRSRAANQIDLNHRLDGRTATVVTAMGRGCDGPGEPG